MNMHQIYITHCICWHYVFCHSFTSTD